MVSRFVSHLLCCRCSQSIHISLKNTKSNFSVLLAAGGHHLTVVFMNYHDQVLSEFLCCAIYFQFQI